MGIEFKNNAVGELYSGISDSDTTIVLKTGQGNNFPIVTSPDIFYATLVDSSGNREIVKCTARADSSDSLTVVRAQEGTAARQWYADDILELRLTAGILEMLLASIEAFTNGDFGVTLPANFKVNVLDDGADCGDTPVITTGINNGAYDIDFPSNNMSACKFMTGNSSTIAWFYQNTAPPGWKALATGADTILGISGGSNAYNVNGGNPGGTWTQPGHTHTGPSHYHSTQDVPLSVDQIPSHTHILVNTDAGTYNTITSGKYCQHNGWAGDFGYQLCGSNTVPTLGKVKETGGGLTHSHGNTGSSGTGATGANATASTYRPSASVGKLFQFDTA